MQRTALEASLLKTLAYFDMFEYPLTATELWKYLYHPELPAAERSLSRVIEALEQSERLRSQISVVEGFYCLKGREALIAERKRRNDRVDHQMRKAVRMVTWLRWFPWIRMIALISSLPMGNVKASSDIDLFIVAKKQYIWLTRLCAAGFLKVLRQRPDGDVSKDRFCLSFFVTEDALDLEPVSFGPDDIVFQYYVASILPIYDPDGLYSDLLKANRWLAKYLPNAQFEQQFVHEVFCPEWLWKVQSCIEFITWPFFNGYFDEWYCNLQLRILPERLKSIANIDSRVIISDQMLKFHDKDNRHEVVKKWHEHIRAYA